jgi:hypothetical protein
MRGLKKNGIWSDLEDQKNINIRLTLEFKD